jgi:hypothetical protein
MAGILLRSRPRVRPVPAAVGTDADQVESLLASPVCGAGWCSSRRSAGPHLRARAAQMCSVDSVIPEAVPVSVATGQVAGLRIRGEPPAEVGNARPGAPAG